MYRPRRSLLGQVTPAPPQRPLWPRLLAMGVVGLLGVAAIGYVGNRGAAMQASSRRKRRWG